MASGSSPVFTRGVYEGPTPFDDVYTRIVDAMIMADRQSYIADPRGTLRRCQQSAALALEIIQQRAFDAVEKLDFVQAETDQAGNRESAWVYYRETLLSDVLGLPPGPYVGDLEDGDVDYATWKRRRA